MVSEKILENPALFANITPDLDSIALEYIQYAKKFSADLRQVKSHVMKFCYTAIKTHPVIMKKISEG